MTIREYAKQKNFEIVGKLTRKAAWEQSKNERWYMDEGNNEYYKHGNYEFVKNEISYFEELSDIIFNAKYSLSVQNHVFS